MVSSCLSILKGFFLQTSHPVERMVVDQDNAKGWVSVSSCSASFLCKVLVAVHDGNVQRPAHTGVIQSCPSGGRGNHDHGARTGGVDKTPATGRFGLLLHSRMVHYHSQVNFRRPVGQLVKDLLAAFLGGSEHHPSTVKSKVIAQSKD